MAHPPPDLFYENRYSHTRMTNPNFCALSESMGAKSLRCTNLADLPAMMKEFLEYDNTRPIVMECIVSSEHVYPMVAAGKALHEQIVSSHPPLLCVCVCKSDVSAAPLAQGDESLIPTRPSELHSGPSQKSLLTGMLRCIYDSCCMHADPGLNGRAETGQQCDAPI